MAQAELSGLKVAILVTDGFEQVEMTEPRKALDDAGAITSIVSPKEGRGRHIVSWPSLRTDLRNAGAEWEDQEAVVDGNLVSSRKPDDIPAFNREMISLFSRAGRQEDHRRVS